MIFTIDFPMNQPVWQWIGLNSHSERSAEASSTSSGLNQLGGTVGGLHPVGWLLLLLPFGFKQICLFVEVRLAVGSSAGKAAAFNCSLLWWIWGGGGEVLWLLLHNDALACQHTHTHTAQTPTHTLMQLHLRILSSTHVEAQMHRCSPNKHLFHKKCPICWEFLNALFLELWKQNCLMM